jgi:hypothetical protein
MNAKLIVRLRCSRRSDLVCLAALSVLASVFLATLGRQQGEAAVSFSGHSTSSAVLLQREYYLTTAPVVANQALSACAAGFHMASLWEIQDPSNLDYNIVLGYALNADQGHGPPTFDGIGVISGWVRTGGASSTTGMRLDSMSRVHFSGAMPRCERTISRGQWR